MVYNLQGFCVVSCKNQSSCLNLEKNLPNQLVHTDDNGNDIFYAATYCPNTNIKSFTAKYALSSPFSSANSSAQVCFYTISLHHVHIPQKIHLCAGALLTIRVLHAPGGIPHLFLQKYDLCVSTCVQLQCSVVSKFMEPPPQSKLQGVFQHCALGLTYFARVYCMDMDYGIYFAGHSLVPPLALALPSLCHRIFLFFTPFSVFSTIANVIICKKNPSTHQHLWYASLFHFQG